MAFPKLFFLAVHSRWEGHAVYFLSIALRPVTRAHLWARVCWRGWVALSSERVTLPCEQTMHMPALCVSEEARVWRHFMHSAQKRPQDTPLFPLSSGRSSFQTSFYTVFILEQAYQCPFNFTDQSESKKERDQLVILSQFNSYVQIPDSYFQKYLKSHVKSCCQCQGVISFHRFLANLYQVNSELMFTIKECGRVGCVFAT